jgi:hypothetical protein
MPKKHLKDDEIKAGYWYIDNNGCKKLYLGVMQKIDCPPLYRDTYARKPMHLYAKYNEIKEHFGADPNSIGIQDIAKAIVFEHHGRPTGYVGIKRHHKFQTECEAHPDGSFAPAVLTDPVYGTQIAFYNSIEEAKPVGYI